MSFRKWVKRGRARQAGPRKPSGDLIRANESQRVKTSRQPHRRGLPEAQRFAQEAETPLGRLYLASHINRSQYHAGESYASAVAAYRATIAGPHQLGAIGEGRRGLNCRAEWCGPDDCLCAAKCQHYMRCYEALAAAGRDAVIAVNRVVIDREAAPIAPLLRGLDALATHMRITDAHDARAKPVTAPSMLRH